MLTKMKRYDDLTDDQKEQAVNQALNDLLTEICSGLRYNDEVNGDNLQAMIDAAIGAADRMRTPWFAHEYILEAKFRPFKGHIADDDGLYPVRSQLTSIARSTAEEAFYPEPSDAVIRLTEHEKT